MSQAEQKKFTVSINELEGRLAEQSLMTALMAVAGAIVATNANAMDCGGHCVEPCCTVGTF